MSFAYLSSTSCTCGRIIGDRFVAYSQLIEKGMSQFDALNYLGLNRICCRTTIISPSPYIVRNGNTGTVSIENVIRPELTEKTPRRGLSLTSSKRGTTKINTSLRPEPKQEYDYRFIRRGEVAVLGYEKDEDGEVVMVDVGDQPGKYYVPRLQLIHGVAHQNVG